jgi:Transglycosylase SLT domain
MRFPRPWPYALCLMLSAFAAPPGTGATDPSSLCLDAAAKAAARTGVPRNVLVAIALVETGQSRNGQQQPWPWTINEGGDGQWFASKAEAVEKAQGAIDLGATNVDLGCFQLNYRWHAEHFASLDDMLDPLQNALYAAGFLARLHAGTGNWPDAAAAYHSRTPEYAERYRAKFDIALAGLDGGPITLAEAAPEMQPNGFRLLIGGKPGAFGSLVPATDATIRLIGAP